MKKLSLRVAFVLLLVVFASGCSFLGGQGTDIFLPGDEDVIIDDDEGKTDEDTGTDTGGVETPEIPIADGFDFPVGDRNGSGWAVTGYRFMDWSNVSNSWHPGEDWNIPGAGNGDFGKPIYSIAHGKVVFSGWNSALGNIVLIQHNLANGTSVWSQYAHLDVRYVKTGDIVWRRQQIGTNGRGPNNRFSAHLHFEIRKHNMAANAWPRTNGQPWVSSKVREYWLHPSNFIKQNRP